MFRLPLLLMHRVLFPEGRLLLNVKEARHAKPVLNCVEKGIPLGICLIAHGLESGVAPIPHWIGTEAVIQDCTSDQSASGLEITVLGKRRFRLLEHRYDLEGGVTSQVIWLNEPPPQKVPIRFRRLRDFLEPDTSVFTAVELSRFNDANWLGLRLSEQLPISVLAKQKLLEFKDPISRLEIIDHYLEKRGFSTKKS
jgi:uncharacterized protein